jgi:hypothetical protein
VGDVDGWPEGGRLLDGLGRLIEFLRH